MHIVFVGARSDITRSIAARGSEKTEGFNIKIYSDGYRTSHFTDL